MVDVSRETIDRLDLFADLVRRWNPRINLVAASTIDDLWPRHIDDSLQIAHLATPVDGVWLDLGSGGGFPGIILSTCFMDTPTQFALVESDQRKATFLRTAIRELHLSNCTVVTARIEDLPPQNATYISARALAPLPRLMPYLHRHLATTGEAWLMKGQQWGAEVAAAQQDWTFTIESHDSRSQTGAAILKIGGVSHV